VANCALYCGLTFEKRNLTSPKWSFCGPSMVTHLINVNSARLIMPRKCCLNVVQSCAISLWKNKENPSPVKTNYLLQLAEWESFDHHSIRGLSRYHPRFFSRRPDFIQTLLKRATFPNLYCLEISRSRWFAYREGNLLDSVQFQKDDGTR